MNPINGIDNLHIYECGDEIISNKSSCIVFNTNCLRTILSDESILMIPPRNIATINELMARPTKAKGLFSLCGAGRAAMGLPRTEVSFSGACRELSSGATVPVGRGSMVFESPDEGIRRLLHTLGQRLSQSEQRRKPQVWANSIVTFIPECAVQGDDDHPDDPTPYDPIEADHPDMIVAPERLVTSDLRDRVSALEMVSLTEPALVEEESSDESCESSRIMIPV
eukprot:gnl/Dysnectes_brevis/2065_a2386_1996.p1 GENE.gnl/Dysnectes_brevis/2065_a2386_1996~~gnl/Dysnectes_brevis/2065_a2386_1996.p1  ORF type:complete len:224 (+),score=46.62 gnl/Dysnectes_brevis/2065_a2386_1996:108-779(+)